ncbi:MAG TPA: sulfatase-like hydrolase/transferase [Acidimicrobiales bacterium]|nr:sulfatase-like hydrolase/transferase [Acidimicrobiales bacterium]
MTGADRPNLLLFMPDQLRADAIGPLGAPEGRTPVLDGLARRGVTFTNAYAQHSVCGPSRVSMFTGWYPHVHGHRTLDNLIKAWEPNVFRQLREAGWYVAQAGPRGDMAAPGVTSASFDWHGLTVRPEHRVPAATWDGSALADAFYAGVRAGEPTVDYDEAAVRTAEELLGGGLPEPWVLFVPLIFPHPPWTVEEPWFSMHDRSAMTDPVTADLSTKPRFMGAIRSTYGLDRLAPADWAEIRAVYAGMVSRVDWQLGRLLDAVEASGAAGRTVVVHFTDHGEYLGDFGLIEKWPAGLDDCLVRNPLVIAGPGCEEGGRCEALVEMVDLTPTLLELAGLSPGYTQFGRSLTKVLADPSATHRSAAFSEGGHRVDEDHVIERAPRPYHLKAKVQQDDPSTLGKAVAMRTEEWTYVMRVHDTDELYHRPSDPAETTNLVSDPARQPVLRRLERQVLEWLADTADVVPWTPDPRFPGPDELWLSWERP